MVTSIVVPAHINYVPKDLCYSSYYIPAKMTEYLLATAVLPQKVDESFAF